MKDKQLRDRLYEKGILSWHEAFGTKMDAIFPLGKSDLLTDVSFLNVRVKELEQKLELLLNHLGVEVKEPDTTPKLVFKDKTPIKGGNGFL